MENTESKKVNIWRVLTISFGILLIISWINIFSSGVSKVEAQEKVEAYLKTLPIDGQVVIDNIVKEHDLYKLDITISGQKIQAYVSKDGSFLFPSVIDLTASPITSATTQETEPKKTCADIKKSDKPVLEAFIVSNCPFGVQMQRILVEIPLKENIKVRYMGSVVDNKVTSMHGEAEAEENLRQICIREEQADKYWDYVSCYIKEGKSQDCLASAKIDTQKLETCMNGKGVDYAKEDFALQDKYSVPGSPTLILDGETVSEFDFGGRTAEAVKTLLCCSFSTQPSACSEALSTEQAAKSFSATYTGSATTTTTGSCG